jgi:DNA-binding transcriptional ArsR family regulator
VGDAFDALAHPTRRRLLRLLVDGERSAGELASHFTETRPAVSRHLRGLREAGLVTVRGEAQRQVYRLDPAALRDVVELLSRLRKSSGA